MAKYTKKGGIKIKGFNGLHDSEVTSSLPFEHYDTLKSVLQVAKLSVRSVTERVFVPEDEIVQGNGTTESYKEGQVFMKRETKGTACLKCLIPLDTTKVNELKATLKTKKFGGETPTSVTMSYTAI